MIPYYTVLLQTTTPYYKALLRTTKYYTILLRTTQCYSVLQSTTQYYSVLQSTTQYYFVLHSTTKYCTVLLRTGLRGLRGLAGSTGPRGLPRAPPHRAHTGAGPRARTTGGPNPTQVHNATLQSAAPATRKRHACIGHASKVLRLSCKTRKWPPILWLWSTKTSISFETSSTFHILKDMIMTHCVCTAHRSEINDATRSRRGVGDDDATNTTRTQVQPQTPTINGNPSLRIREKTGRGGLLFLQDLFAPLPMCRGVCICNICMALLFTEPRQVQVSS